MAAAQGKGDQWQQIAAANTIENPRMLDPGQLINMNPPTGGLSPF
jgi:nucleoid-associated protein YgaU